MFSFIIQEIGSFQRYHDTYNDGESKELTKRNLYEHFRIVQAIEARDPDAAEKAMQDHLNETKKFLLQYIDKKSQ